MHVLTEQLGKDITNDEALMAAESSVDVETLLEISAIIKVLADNPDYTPENESSILDILTASDQGVETSLEDYFAKNKMLDESGEFITELFKAVEQAKQQTIEDPSVTPNFTLDEIEGTYVLHASVADGWVPAYGNVLRINENNQAWLGQPWNYELSPDESSTWVITPTGELYLSSLDIDASVDHLELDEIVDLFGEDILTALPLPHRPSYWVNKTLRGMKLSKLTKGQESKVAVKYTYQLTLDYPIEWPNGEPTVTTESVGTTVLSKNIQNNEIWSEAPIGDWAMPVIKELDQSYDESIQNWAIYQRITLDENMEVLDSVGNTIGRWHFDSGQLTITSPDGWTVSYRAHDEINGLISAIISFRINDKELNMFRWIAPFEQEESSLAEDVVQSMPNILGSSLNIWTSSENKPNTQNVDSVYGYALADSGEASRIWTTYDDEENGLPYFTTHNDFIQQWASPNQYDYVLSGTYDAGYWVHERKRNWKTISTLENGYHLVLEDIKVRETYTTDNSVTERYWIFPRINVLKPIDLSVYEDAYQLSKEKGSITE
uniref:carboxypeptidase regulatory-like domain-containing protein n=1 Tax=Vibrio alfacsensis TaxID=1074311 RepID=UPI001F4A07F8|nr:carboxypeptidase regulatory-like domain-containing protein [Vibrio alfacsensis]